MSFKSRSFPCSVFQIDDPSKITLDALKKHAFVKIDDTVHVEQGMGWTSYYDMLDTTWENSQPNLDNFLFFSLRIDTRKVPIPLINRHYKEYMAKNKVPKKERKALRETIKKQLITQTSPVPRTIDIIIDKLTRIAYISNISEKTLGLIKDLFSAHFDANVQDFNSKSQGENLVAHFFTTLYSKPLKLRIDDEDFSLFGHDNATFLKDKQKVQVLEEPNSAVASLEAGLVIKKIKLELETEHGIYTFNIDDKFRFSSFKMPVVESKNYKRDYDALYLEQTFLLKLGIHAVYEIFNKEFENFK